jgi:predicted phage-related endonuclease
MNQHAIISPHALAISAKPAGVVTIPISDREQWLKLREADVTASVVGAILGVSPYTTYWGLWMLKAGRMPPEHVAAEPEISADGNEITLPPAARGHQREHEAISMLKLLRPDWRVSYPLSSYWRDPERRLGATPDCLVIDHERGLGVVQVKSVAPHVYAEQWTDADTREIVPPVWVVLQAIQEAMLTGAAWAAVAVHRENYGSRPSVRLIEIPLHAAVWARIIADTADFWASIDAGSEPAPDFKRDAEGIMRLYSDADDRTVDLDGERAQRIAAILDQRAKLKARESDGSAAEKDRKVVDAEIIHALGNAERGRLPDGRVIAAPTTRRATIDAAVVRKEMGADWAAARSKTSAFRVIKISGEAA